MSIKGTTKVLAVIGYPIQHSGSPKMQNSMIRQLCLDMVYIPLEVDPKGLVQAIDGICAMNVAGFNVTVPFKEAIIPYLDEQDELSLAIGAVNTVVNNNGTLKGYNTDGQGFLLSLKEELNVDVEGKRVAILGAGGSARSISYAMLCSGVASLHVLNRTKNNAKKLAKELTFDRLGSVEVHSLTDYEVLSKMDIVVNTTSVGMAPHTNDVLLESLEWVSPGQIVVDIIYNPDQTKLLTQAQMRGARIMNGKGMLAGQGALSFELFTGEKADYNFMKNNI